MRPYDIRAGRSYVTPQGWVYRVNVISREGLVDYTVRTGKESGRSGETPVYEFADRVVRTVECGKWERK